MLGSKIVFLADNMFKTHKAKTTMGILRNTNKNVLAVIDRSLQGLTVGKIKDTNDDTPIIGNLQDILYLNPTTLIMGTYPPRGILPDFWKDQILLAINHHMNIISWFHRPLINEPIIKNAIENSAVRLFDVRQNNLNYTIVGETQHPPKSLTILTVGSDCSVGKMTTALSIMSETQKRHIECNFVATGQAGIILTGEGLCIDNIPGDYIASELELFLRKRLKNNCWTIVEGQGSIIHPSFSGVTLSLLHSTKPDALVLCLDPMQQKIAGTDRDIPPIQDLIEIYKSATNWISPTSFVGVSINCEKLSNSETIQLINDIEHCTGLPTTDCIKFGPEKLVDSLQSLFDRKMYEPMTT